MKMYIFIKDDVPVDMTPLVAAHASLACYLVYQEDKDMQKWQKTSFKKVVCKVNDAQFKHLKVFDKYNVTTESSLDNKEVSISFCPREEFPKPFRKYKLWTF